MHWKFFGYEMPFPFGKVDRTAPPKAAMETRLVANALEHPLVAFHDPSSLSYPDHMLPVNPSNGGYITCGLGMVTYDHQATWDRSRVELAGPVKEFFRGMMWDNRVKHL